MGRIANVNEINFRIGEKSLEPAIFLDDRQIHKLTAWPKVAPNVPPIASKFLGITTTNSCHLRVAQAYARRESGSCP